MNTRKLFVTLMLIAVLSMLMCSTALAKSYFLTKDKEALDAKTSGDIEAVSEEAKASGEEAKAEEPAETEEVKVSGEEAKAEEPEVSGEEAKAEEPAKSGDEAEVKEDETQASGEEVVAKDINGDEWYADYAAKALKDDIMETDEEGNFNGDEKVTRADVLDALMKGVNARYKIETKDEEAFLKTTATREETAYLVYLYAKSIDKGFKGTWAFQLDYEDQDQISQEAYEAVAWCNVNKIIIGRTENTLNPLSVTTRAELATIVVRSVDVLK